MGIILKYSKYESHPVSTEPNCMLLVHITNLPTKYQLPNFYQEKVNTLLPHVILLQVKKKKNVWLVATGYMKDQVKRD